MKRLLSFLLVAFVAMTVCAQHPNGKKFDPEQFNRDHEAFITQEAKLTPQEASVFFPVFREFMTKQREIFMKQRALAKEIPADDKAATRQISEYDNLDLQMTKLRTAYHQKFVKVLGARKVLKCLLAEEHFKQKVMLRLSKKHGADGKRPPRDKNKK